MMMMSMTMSMETTTLVKTTILTTPAPETKDSTRMLEISDNRMFKYKINISNVFLETFMYEV